jgi:hypothetical protein
MPDATEDLHATADDLTADARQLAAIEGEKAQLDASDPKAEDLSRTAERLVRRMVPKAVAERELTEEAGGS